MKEAQDMRQKLEAYLKGKFPQREELSVVELKRTAGGLEGGMSYETSFVTISWREAQGPVSETLVIRVEPEYGVLPPYDIRPQYEVIKRVYGTGVPVPKVFWLEMDRKVLGRPFFIMETVQGEVLDSPSESYYRNHPEHQEQLMKDLISVLAKIHGLDWQVLGLSVLGVPEHDRQHAEKDIARWERLMEENQYSPQPVMTELFTWLKRNIPRAERTTLYHGDCTAHNFLVRDGRIVAALDWELTGIGDPIFDVAWFCFCNSPIMAGVWTEADVIRTYEEMTGVKVNEESLFYWKVFIYTKIASMGFTGTKTGIEFNKLDIRFLEMYPMMPPMMQEMAAQMLGF